MTKFNVKNVKINSFIAYFINMHLIVSVSLNQLFEERKLFVEMYQKRRENYLENELNIL